MRYINPRLTLIDIDIEQRCVEAVCQSACMSQKRTSVFHQMFRTRYLLPWLCLPLKTVQYVMCFRFCG